MDALTCRDIAYRYAGNRVLDGISFRAPNGISIILGPNGAGKSTLLRVLATELRAAAGTIAYAGRSVATERDLRWFRSAVGYLPQRFSCMDHASVLDNVMYSAWSHGVAIRDCERAADRALDVTGLREHARIAARRLSGGMRQRMGMACAIAHAPGILLLDEPTVGIDPRQRLEIRRFLVRYAERAIVLMSTHIVDEVPTLANRVLVLDSGHMVFDGSVERFRSLGDGRSYSTLWESAYIRALEGAGRA